MSNRNNRTTRRTGTIGRTRATRAIVASGSLLAIIVIGLPWVDEYLRLRRESAEFSDLQVRLVESQQREEQLNRAEARISSDLETLVDRSTDPTKKEEIRETLIEFVRQAGGRIRRLEIADGETRVWGLEEDNPRNDTMPLYGEESRFVLHTHTVELQADGSLESVRQILGKISNQGWLMTTKSLAIVPTALRESPIGLEVQLVLYGLGPNERDPEEEFAQQLGRTALR